MSLREQVVCEKCKGLQTESESRYLLESIELLFRAQRKYLKLSNTMIQVRGFEQNLLSCRRKEFVRHLSKTGYRASE